MMGSLTVRRTAREPTLCGKIRMKMAHWTELMRFLVILRKPSIQMPMESVTMLILMMIMMASSMGMTPSLLIPVKQRTRTRMGSATTGTPYRIIRTRPQIQTMMA